MSLTFGGTKGELASWNYINTVHSPERQTCFVMMIKRKRSKSILNLGEESGFMQMIM